MRRRVELAETNASGEVQIPAIIRWMEETEYAMLRSRGLSVSLTDDRGRLGFPRIKASVNLHDPVRLGDSVVVQLLEMDSNGKTIDYRFAINRLDNDSQSTGQIVADGQFTVACCRFPDSQLPYAVLIPDFVFHKLFDEKESR